MQRERERERERKRERWGQLQRRKHGPARTHPDGIPTTTTVTNIPPHNPAHLRRDEFDAFKVRVSPRRLPHREFKVRLAAMHAGFP